MKRVLVLACAAAMVLGFYGGASALTFTLESYEVRVNDRDPGLVLYWEALPFEPSFSLGVGESRSLGLFTVGTRETYVHYDDVFPKEIFVSFHFSAPEVMGDVVEGWSRGRWLLQDGVIRWNSPLQFRFAETGVFTVALDDVWIRDLSRPEAVTATITYVQEGRQNAAPVPEPASILLLGVGLLGWAALRKRRG